MSNGEFLEDFKEKWLLPVVIAITSLLVSQMLLWQLSVPIPMQIAFFICYLFTLATGSRTFGFVFIYRVMVPLTFGIIMVWVYRWSYDIQPLADFLNSSKSNFQYLELLFDILATLYAICTAFLLWKGLTDHDTLRQMLSNEANLIERLIGYLHYFNDRSAENRAFTQKLRNNLLSYVKNIVRGDQIRMNPENSELIRKSVLLISDVKIYKDSDYNDRVALEQTIICMSDLAMARSQRISQMEVRMSPYLLMALSVMSLAVIYPFFTEPPAQTDFVRESCIMILTSLLSFLIVTLLDISRPFNGFWKIKTDVFDSITNLLESEISRDDLSQEEK